MKLIFTIIISIITLFLAWLFIENQSSDEISVPDKEKITNEEMEKKLTDLTTISKRISKKNKYLNLEQASKSDFLIEPINYRLVKN